MNGPYTVNVRAGWGDMDFNAHMANTAYLDYAADVRLMYFASQGFSAADFARERLGPVVMKDEIVYRAEIRLQEEVRVSLELAGLSDDGSRFRLRNTFCRDDGRIAAVVTTDAGWLDLDLRRLAAPPPALLEGLRHLVRTENFEELPSSLKDGKGRQ